MLLCWIQWGKLYERKLAFQDHGQNYTNDPAFLFNLEFLNSKCWNFSANMSLSEMSKLYISMMSIYLIISDPFTSASEIH